MTPSVNTMKDVNSALLSTMLGNVSSFSPLGCCLAPRWRSEWCMTGHQFLPHGHLTVPQLGVQHPAHSQVASGGSTINNTWSILRHYGLLYVWKRHGGELTSHMYLVVAMNEVPFICAIESMIYRKFVTATITVTRQLQQWICVAHVKDITKLISGEVWIILDARQHWVPTSDWVFHRSPHNALLPHW